MALKKWLDCGARARVGGAAAAVLLLSACASGPRFGPYSPVTTITIPVERLAYPPLLPKLPFTAGIHYPESIRTAFATIGGGDTPRCRYEFGPAAGALFDQNAAAMFARTVHLPSIPTPAATATEVDIVLVPHFEPLLGIVFAETAAPTTIMSGLKLGVDAFAPDGSSIAKIEARVTTPTGPDSKATATKQPTETVATQLLTEAVGDLATLLVMSPDLARWAESRGVAWRWPQASSVDSAAAPPAGVAIVVCSLLYSCSATKATVAVGEALHRLDPSITIVDAEDVRHALYPWVSRASLTNVQQPEWLHLPAIAARAGKAGVRHLVVAKDLDQWTTGHGYLAGGGTAIFGLAWSKRHQSAHIWVFDFATATDAGDVKQERERVSWVVPAWVLPLPIPIPGSGEAMPEAIAKQLLPLVRAGR